MRASCSMEFEHSLVPRLRALQPAITVDQLLDVEDVSTSAAIVSHLTQLIRIWAHDNARLPGDFEGLFSITNVERQVVAFAVSDLQILRRETKHVDEPWDKGLDRKLSTAEPKPIDHFAFPFDATAFPPDPEVIVDDLRVPNGAWKIECSECGTAGTIECKSCEGACTIVCDACNGDLGTPCKDCGGSGHVLRGGQTTVDCATCRGSGEIECVKCSGRGTVRCPACNGQGQATCNRCGSSGYITRRQVLHSETSTLTRAIAVTSQEWEIDLTPAFADADELYSQNVRLEGNQAPHISLGGHIRLDLRKTLQDVAVSVINDYSNQTISRAGRIERSTGLRIRLHGSFAYRVNFDYRGSRGALIVVGRDNQVYMTSGPSRRASIVDSALEKLDGIFARIGLSSEPTGLDRAYANAVRKGEAFLADSSRIVPLVAASIGALVLVTDNGYRLTFPDGSEFSAFDGAVVVTFNCDTYQQLVIGTSVKLGVAHRDRYPQALAYSRRTAVGRIAIVAGEAGKIRFALIDVRPYASLSAFTYEKYLRLLLRDLREISASGVIR